MNQVTGMVAQIRNDVLVGTHKYMAHQIALLYQALSYLNTTSANGHRKAIEANFDDLKRTTEDPPHALEPQQKVWVLDMCDTVEKFILSVPGSLEKRVAPVVDNLVVQ